MRIRVPLLAIAFALAATPAVADIQITVNKTAQTLTVARDGQVLHTWPVSTGRTGRFTPAGNFRAFRMEKDHFSREFDDAPMPHSIFFTQRGHAIHGSFETKKLGRPASGGCVRLAPENAKILFELVEAEGVLKTKVEIEGDERVAIARANRGLTEPEQRQAGRPLTRQGETGLPPQYVPRDDELRARERYAAPRNYYDQQFGYQQQPYNYNNYVQRYGGSTYYRGNPQPYYDQRNYYPPQPYSYQRRYGYGWD